MPNSKYDVRELAKHIAEGRHDQVLRERAAYKTADPAFPIFLRFVILDVISDPSVIDATKLAHWEHDLGVGNIPYATVAPRNSIIARRVMSAEGGASDKVMVLYPFFPPHLAFPAKPGEHVWAMFENPDAKVNDLGYWFCRIVHPNFVEDQNYTHADRQFDASFLPGLSDVFEGTADPKYEFHNGAVAKDAQSGDRYVNGNTPSLPGDDKVYEKLLKEADAARVAQYEAVPRYRKRPQDTVFEGSNNTLIVLGTDRTGPAADYDTDEAKGKVPKPPNADIIGEAGAIDIVAGRGQTAATGGKAETNSLGNKELGKAKPDIQDKEGDVDIINDRARVLVAQKTKPDTNLALANVISQHLPKGKINDGNGEGAVVEKSDKIRLIARHDVAVIVTGATETDDKGNVKDPGTGGATVDPSQCASFIIDSAGNISHQAAKDGQISTKTDNCSLVLDPENITENAKTKITETAPTVEVNADETFKVNCTTPEGIVLGGTTPLVLAPPLLTAFNAMVAANSALSSALANPAAASPAGAAIIAPALITALSATTAALQAAIAALQTQIVTGA